MFDAMAEALDEDDSLAAEIIGMNFENACAQAGVSPSDIADCDPVKYSVTQGASGIEDDRIEVFRM